MKLQKRLAAAIKKVGKKRVRIRKPEEMKEAITREDIRVLLKTGAIEIEKKKGVSRGRARKNKEQRKKGRRKGEGKKKGRVLNKKEKWVKKVRAQRKFIKMLAEKKKIGPKTYRNLYRKVGGGYFRSVSHIKTYLEKRGEELGR
jgi:large subunit ribosomal protein L19e